ncbi:MAG TPA: ATP synthase F1 subunit epsilon [Candidatus Binatia bacterium]|nr:ATP synthase F1 subunit epsilon [Candidatus Binatia bacterium]
MIHLQIVTLTGTKFDDDVYEVILPTLDGEIGVLPGHMPLVSVATGGAIAVRRQPKDPDWNREFFATGGGVIEVEGDNLRVIVDEADHATEIDESEAKAAHERALKMKAEAKDQVSLERAQDLLDISSTRLQVANLKRRHQKR